MATYNGNGVYIDIDGTRIDAYFQNVSMDRSLATVDATAGSSSTDVERNAGLLDTKGKITIAYDDTMAATHLALLKPGAHTLTYGPEGNTTGKPKHVQAILITALPHTITVKKDLVVWEATWEAAAAPSTNMYAGGVW